jgi:hypothetical protein
MSNYPPGVTGNEFEISGPDREWEEEFQCENDEFEYVMISPETFEFMSELGNRKYRTDTFELVKKNVYHYVSMIDAMFNSSSITTQVQVAKCGFVGDVLKQSYRDETWWECPHCGKHYEERITDYYSE